MYSSGMFFFYLFSSALVFALVNRVLRHRLTYISAFSVLAALGWGISSKATILSRRQYFSVFIFLSH
jgi:membrane protein involved in D-alanine export